MKLSILSVTLALLAVAGAAPVGLEKRRFGQEHTPQADATFQAMKDISVGTGFEAQLGDLSGAAVRALLAKAGACDQQDVADQCVDFAHQIGQKFASSNGPQKEKDLIKVCKDYRVLERNTPNVGQPSELCNKKPKNKELDGLVQAQDPSSTTTPAAQNPAATTPTATTTATTTPTATTTTPAADPKKNPKKDPCTTTTPCDTPTTPCKDATTTTPCATPTTPCKDATPTKPCKDATTTTPAATTTTTPAATTTTTPAATTPTNPPASNANVKNEAFTNPVGGVQMPLIKKLPAGSGANFEVNGSQFQNIGAAQNRQCDVQHNLCFNKFNSGDHSFSGADCDNQNNVCKAGDPVFSN